MEKDIITIPKIIHFIWAGGRVYMPPKNMEVVKNWKETNPEFDIYIWIDDKKSPEIFLEQIEHYAQFFSGHNDLSGIEACLQYLSNQKMELKDITEEGVVDEYSRYEIDRLRPNYGASSDLLRYSILFKFGGAYFDSDVEVGSTKLIDINIFDKILQKHFLYVDGNSQGSNSVGNDTFISTINNPLMYKIYERAKKNYNPHAEINDERWYATLPALLYRYDHHDYILDSTIQKTGPGCVRDVINPEKHKEYEECVDIQNHTDLTKNLKKNINYNDRAWTQKKIPLGLSLAISLGRIKKTILFEAEKLKILRLDDHINNYIKSTALAIEEAANAILILIGSINWQDIQGIQITFQITQSMHFVSKKNLLEKTFLFPLSEPCQKHYGNHLYYDLPTMVIFEDLKKIPLSNLSFLIECYSVWINNRYPVLNKNEVKVLSEFAHKILKYFQNLSRNLGEISGLELSLYSFIQLSKKIIRSNYLTENSNHEVIFSKKLSSSSSNFFSNKQHDTENNEEEQSLDNQQPDKYGFPSFLLCYK